MYDSNVWLNIDDIDEVYVVNFFFIIDYVKYFFWR